MSDSHPARGVQRGRFVVMHVGGWGSRVVPVFAAVVGTAAAVVVAGVVLHRGEFRGVVFRDAVGARG